MSQRFFHRFVCFVKYANEDVVSKNKIELDRDYILSLLQEDLAGEELHRKLKDSQYVHIQHAMYHFSQRRIHHKHRPSKKYNELPVGSRGFTVTNFYACFRETSISGELSNSVSVETMMLVFSCFQRQCYIDHWRYSVSDFNLADRATEF